MPTSSTPDVSVTVIVYNDAERLPRAVESVLSQTLHNLEVIIADDCSTDDTPSVARALAARDPRVRYERLEQNSGGCSAPRNRGIAISRAPYLMFLDSDDELPRHACKSLLLEMERTNADFVTGEVERYFEATKRTGLWYPHLFVEPRTVQGIAEAPEMLFDHLSTNKMYRRDFIERHQLTFPEGIHYEDQLFSAQAFTLAKSFAVVPWVVYRWFLADDSAKLSISSSRHKLQNVRDRLTVATLVDDFLDDQSASAQLKADKDYKFLRHDFRLYLGDLPHRDPSWVAEFAEVTTPYLDALAPEAIERLSRTERVCIHLIRTGRPEEAAVAARSLGNAQVGPRHSVVDSEDRRYWGQQPPLGERDRSELDISEMFLDRQIFPSAILRHEIEQVLPEGQMLRLRVRTFDPGGVLDREPIEATCNLAGSGPILHQPLTVHPDPDAPGEFVGEVVLDLGRVPMGINGFSGRRHPTITLKSGDSRNSGVLLAPQDCATFTRTVVYHRVGTHLVQVRKETAGVGRLEVTWARSGAFQTVSRLGPVQRKVKRRVKKLRKSINAHENKALAYQLLSRLPVRKGLAVFESVEGRGYLDNPRYIHEELVRQGRRLHVVWSHNGNRSSYPKGTKLVRRGSWSYVRALARAEYWVDSHNLPSIYTRRPGTHYLQTWHGQTMKTIGYDVPSLRTGPEQSRLKHQGMVDRWDALVSPSDEFERTFVPANRYQGAVIRSGYPRNDVLVRWEETEQRERATAARKRLWIPEGAKVALYAPTFRDYDRRPEASMRLDLHELASLLGPEWVVAVRAHYYARFRVPAELSHVVRDASVFEDVNDALLAADVLVTDYSSLMFDYANTRRPIVLYADDYELYSSHRGTYYDLPEVAPGPIVQTTAELADTLTRIDEVNEQFADRYARFREMFCSYETGRASAAVVDAFFGKDAR